MRNVTVSQWYIANTFIDTCDADVLGHEDLSAMLGELSDNVIINDINMTFTRI